MACFLAFTFIKTCASSTGLLKRRLVILVQDILQKQCGLCFPLRLAQKKSTDLLSVTAKLQRQKCVQTVYRCILAPKS